MGKFGNLCQHGFVLPLHPLKIHFRDLYFLWKICCVPKYVHLSPHFDLKQLYNLKKILSVLNFGHYLIRTIILHNSQGNTVVGAEYHFKLFNKRNAGISERLLTCILHIIHTASTVSSCYGGSQINHFDVKYSVYGVIIKNHNDFFHYLLFRIFFTSFRSFLSFFRTVNSFVHISFQELAKNLKKTAIMFTFCRQF